MQKRSKRVRARWAAALVSSVMLAACASSPPPAAESGDPPLDEPGPAGEGPIAPASSDKVQKGIDAIQAGDFEAAKSVLSEARTESPKDAQAAFYLGVALENLKDGEGATREYRAALELDGKLAEAAVNLSALLLDAGDHAGALAVVDAALPSAPKHPDLLMNRALALDAGGKSVESLEAFGKAVAARPDNVELRISYADLLIKADRNKDAVEQLRAAGTPEDPRLLAALAHHFGKAKSPADCVAVLDKALAAKPEAELHVRRGLCRHEAGDQAGEKSDYEAALKLDEKSAPAHFYFGMYLKSRDKAQAIKHLEQAAALMPGQGVGAKAKEELAALKKGKR